MNLKLSDWKVWLVRSTFGIDYYKNLPNNLCKFFWMFIASLIALPFSLINHSINLIHNRKNPEMHTGYGIMLMIIGTMPGGIILEHFHLLNNNDKIIKLLQLLAISPIGCIAIILAVSAIAAIGYCVYLSVKSITIGINHIISLFKPRYDENKPIKEHNPSIIKEYIESYKNKYCKKLEYDLGITLIINGKPYLHNKDNISYADLYKIAFNIDVNVNKNIRDIISLKINNYEHYLSYSSDVMLLRPDNKYIFNITIPV